MTAKSEPKVSFSASSISISSDLHCEICKGEIFGFGLLRLKTLGFEIFAKVRFLDYSEVSLSAWRGDLVAMCLVSRCLFYLQGHSRGTEDTLPNKKRKAIPDGKENALLAHESATSSCLFDFCKQGVLSTRAATCAGNLRAKRDDNP
ncbi:hypothetical protein Dimus_001195 [Dionaea muscipula]